jgi:hypothetical protein
VDQRDILEELYVQRRRLREMAESLPAREREVAAELQEVTFVLNRAIERIERIVNGF